MKLVTFQPGQQVCGERGGTFRILEWIGEGSYSRVYRAQGNGDLVALKLAKGEVAGTSERLLQEQAAHTVLTHPAIPPLVDWDISSAGDGHRSGAVWLAREWVEGNTLAHFLASGRRLPLVQAVPVLRRIADAIAVIHQAGWSHGDLRPQNLLLQVGTHLAFLLDLGEAQQCGSAVNRAPEARGVRRSLSSVIRPRPMALPSAGATAAGPVPCTPEGRALILHDLQQLGELLAWTLTGEDPHLHPDRLSAAAGFHPLAVQIWQDTRTGRLTSAATFRDSLERLARQLGAVTARRQG